jgi:nitrilase
MINKMSLVAVIQMVSTADLSKNLESAERLIKEASEQGAKLVLLPENFALLESTGLYPMAVREAQTADNLLTRLASWSVKYDIWLLAGSLPSLVEGSQRVRSSLFVFSPSGEIVARYDKRHLFDVQVTDAQGSYQESSFIEPGDQLVVVDTDVGRVGLSICYDLRFSDHFWQLRRMGAEIIVVPSAFTKMTGDAHWEVLLRARAIETQCYILGANQGGQHNATRLTSGHSMIVDPWGVVKARCELGEAVVVRHFERELLENIRAKMPVLQQARG